MRLASIIFEFQAAVCFCCRSLLAYPHCLLARTLQNLGNDIFSAFSILCSSQKKIFEFLQWILCLSSIHLWVSWELHSVVPSALFSRNERFERKMRANLLRVYSNRHSKQDLLVHARLLKIKDELDNRYFVPCKLYKFTLRMLLQQSRPILRQKLHFYLRFKYFYHYLACPNRTFGSNGLCMACPDNCDVCQIDGIFRSYL